VVAGIAACWLGVLLAYDSYYWPPAGHGWPVSFLIVTVIFVFYVVVDLSSRALRRRRRLSEAPADA